MLEASLSQLQGAAEIDAGAQDGLKEGAPNN
jgi:hypothetical protein